jgi:hypothetical protein
MMNKKKRNQTMKITKTQLQKIIKEEIDEMIDNDNPMGAPPRRRGDIKRVQGLLDQLAQTLGGDPDVRAAQVAFVEALEAIGWTGLSIGTGRPMPSFPV